MGTYTRFSISNRACPECENTLIADKSRRGIFGCTACHNRFRENAEGELDPWEPHSSGR